MICLKNQQRRAYWVEHKRQLTRYRSRPKILLTINWQTFPLSAMQCPSVNLFWCPTQNDLVKWGIPQNVGQPSQLIVCWIFMKRSLTEKDFAKLDGQTVNVIIDFAFRKPAKKVNITYFGAQVIPRGTS